MQAIDRSLSSHVLWLWPVENESIRVEWWPNLAGIPHMGSLQAQRAIQTRWWHHSQVLQGHSNSGLSNKVCDSCREPCFLSIFVVFGPPPVG